MPVLVPAWLVLADISAQALRLYCLYKLQLPNFSRPPVHFPQCPAQVAATLQLDLEQYEAARQELIAVGAVEEDHRVDEAGTVRTVLIVNELSPSQKEEDDKRERWRQEQRAKLRAEGSTGQARAAAKGFVYVIAQAGTSRVKIGYARDVTSRLKNLQTSNPYQLEVLWHTRGNRSLEDALHRRFAKYRTQGEWFEFGRLNPVTTVESAVNDIRPR
ncbi:GIY-YIG nuclease family protein [Amycolatopsis sp. NPDC004079]|uniref:GIY-YIG nuclease family protein n=1 Tax=Amycolatopsis sp. NPDC004079 TaxID=3154549 RepID=UPI0033BE9167